jgi:hypothetical protein
MISSADAMSVGSADITATMRSEKFAKPSTQDAELTMSMQVGDIVTAPPRSWPYPQPDDDISLVGIIIGTYGRRVVDRDFWQVRILWHRTNEHFVGTVAVYPTGRLNKVA